MQYHVFFISDGTGITSESFGQSLLAQFDDIAFIRRTCPYINSKEKAQDLVEEFQRLYEATKIKAIVFSTIIDVDIAQVLNEAPIHMYDIFNAFIPPLEKHFKKTAVHQIGKKRSILENKLYDRRIEAVHFALDNDDGIHSRDYPKADLILIGVSRCGKTPSCLYLGLQFGIHAANYPLTDDDLLASQLPSVLTKHKEKLFALTIDPERLNKIRQERRPNSHYASYRQCLHEVQQAEGLFHHHQVPMIDTTQYSIEEIATRILSRANIERRIK